MKWFSNPKSLEDLKIQYKKLALKHHPDRGGRLEDMKQINAEYDELFARLQYIHENAKGETYTAEKSAEAPDEYRDIINAVIGLENITIEICGSWLWITGNTYIHREILKKLHFRFSKSKLAWYYHNDGWSRRGKKKFSLEEIRQLHGSEIIKGKPELRLRLV